MVDSFTINLIINISLKQILQRNIILTYTEIQEIGSRIDGVSLGRDATRLRKILEAFPRYKNSEIIGPDIKSCETQEEARYLKNFIIESGSSISAVTYQV